mgnify:CR=1 FL=1|tara:strand:+ start:109 stop:480 length:372 start_codon:yes stop_codon:yes gene_type:complete
MTVKLALLKSGEEIISDMSEMMSGQDGGGQVVGYFFNHPCRAVLTSPEIQVSDEQESERKPVAIRLLPWMPLSKDERIPVVADWVISIVEPQDKLLEMYNRAVKTYEERKSENSNTDEQSESD